MNTRDPYEKTFPAVPPTHGRAFADTWWGHAWLRALEDSALDGKHVKQGRRYARAGAVGAVSVRPGGLTAVVRDPDGSAHRTDVLVQEFTEAEWDRLLDLAAAEAGHIAALLDREVPPELAEDAAAAGVELLPGIGDLDPRCDCGEWDHCPHTAALCYQVARLLDQDPFVLLLLRGRGERELVDELAERSTAEAKAGADAPQAPADEGVPAAEVFAAGAARPALPPLPGLPRAPGHPPTLDTETDAETGLDVDAVEFLAQAAAAEAHRRLAEALAPGHADRAPEAPLTRAEDAVRLAAEAGDFRVRSRLAAATGRSRAEMELAVRAWGFGAAPGLAALEDDWTPGRSELARAGSDLAAAWADEEAPVLRRVRARWTEAGTDRQLRLGREGRWWPYRRSAGRWIPSGPSAPDPASALEADPAP
ncbi:MULTISPECIES: SWIM zinc finger family protein [unclassified Streptomyces]|uniref:SWIM zinc finger family protein n=1 Tax=unclassified Streptomyces TaxID=2593676 RepID=UPI002E0DB8F8|nr:SWF or SNF family helicase [Streptomyces sp. NBC_01207]WTA22459.1 SWF or SNF family helicase [Streptomyces sp. NBC_00853]